MTKEEKEELIRQKENLKLFMEDLSKFLPTADMQADFELFKNMTPEERAMFQEKRAQKIEAMPGDEKKIFTEATEKGLKAIKSELQDVKLALELGDVANALSTFKR